MGKIILVTGSTGFIGQNLIKHLSKKNDEIVGIGRKIASLEEMNYLDTYYPVDLNNYESTYDILDEIRPNVIIHLAGHPLAKVQNIDPTIQLRNINITQNLLYAACHFENLNKVILASSVVVYGNADKTFVETDETKPETEYAISKLVSEQLVRLHCERHNKKYCILRLGATIGKNMTHGLIPDLILKVLQPGRLSLLGNTVKPYTHIDDVCSIFSRAVYHDLNGVYNACSNESISVEDIARTIMSHYGVEKDIHFEGTWAGDQTSLKINNDKLVRSGWKQKYNQQETILRCL